MRNADVTGGIALHWHGVDVPNAQDGVAGVTQDAVMPGRGPHLPLGRAATPARYWYHSHQLSHEQVTGGLLGPLLIHPEEPRSRGARRLALAHLYDGRATVNGREPDVAGSRPSRASGSACGW